jgi:hypothetical protein
MQRPLMNHAFIVGHFDSHHHSGTYFNYETCLSCFSYLFMHLLLDGIECGVKSCVDGVRDSLLATNDNNNYDQVYQRAL